MRNRIEGKDCDHSSVIHDCDLHGDVSEFKVIATPMYRMVTRNKREYIQKMMSEIDKEEKQIDNMYTNFAKGLGRNSPVKKDADLRIKKSRTTLRKFGKHHHHHKGSAKNYASMINNFSMSFKNGAKKRGTVKHPNANLEYNHQQNKIDITSFEQQNLQLINPRRNFSVSFAKGNAPKNN